MNNNLGLEIKHNFLKQILFRLDYEGILEADIENCILKLRQFLYEAGFVNLENRVENQADFQVKIELNLPIENPFSINSVSRSPVYRFLSADNKSLEIGKSFFTFTIDIDKRHENFDRYITLLTEVIDTIKNVSSYFRALRIGLRKINICFLDSLSSLPLYFTHAAFNMDDLIKQFPDYGCTASNMVTILTTNGYQTNYTRNIQEGVMQQEDGSQKTAYQVVLDVDVYKENGKELSILLSSKDQIENTLRQQNTIESEIFIRSLRDQFVELLKKETFANNEIRGVI